MGRKATKFFKVVLGGIVLSAGCGLVGLSTWQITQGQLAWISIAIIGGGLGLAGWILIAYKNIRDFWEALRDVCGV